MNVSAVFAIQTEGRADMEQWVTSYRVEFSQDCNTFNYLTDVHGNNKVLIINILETYSLRTFSTFMFYYFSGKYILNI